MKADWALKRLGDVALVIAGQSPDGTYYNENGLGLPFYQGKKEFHDRILGPPTTWTTQITKEALPQDILMSVRAPVGPVNVASERICIGRGLAAIRAKKGLLQEFLFYFLRSQQDALEGKEGAVFSSIGRSEIENILVPVPSLAEQNRVVGVLDEVFEGLSVAVANTKKSLLEAELLFSIRRDAVFDTPGSGWVRTRLSSICEIKHGYAFEGQYFSSEGPYVLLTPGNFFESGGYRERGDKQKFYTGDVPAGYVLSKGDLLVAMTEQAAGLLGSPILVPESGVFLHNQRLGLVNAAPGVRWLPDFVFHIFNTRAVRRELHASASGAKVRHTSPTKIGQVEVAFCPSIEEQRTVVEALFRLRKEVDKLEAVYEEKVRLLDSFRDSVLHHTFIGLL